MEKEERKLQQRISAMQRMIEGQNFEEGLNLEQLMKQLESDINNRANLIELRQIGVLKKLSYYNGKNEQVTYLIQPNNKTKTKISYLEPYQNLAKFHTISGRVGVVNFKTGKIILDTIYTDVSLNYENYNLVWVIKNQGEKWMVFDTSGVKKTPIYFEQIHLFTDPVITSNLNFRNPDAFKMLITTSGLEELRCALHY
jgi:hypothetical protein